MAYAKLGIDRAPFPGVTAASKPLIRPITTYSGETLPADAFASTVYRLIDESMGGWNICYHNNSDVVTAWRSEGGAMTEAEGIVEAGCFHPDRMRVVAGAVDASGSRAYAPGPWSRRVAGKIRLQYDLAGAAYLERNGFSISPNEITPV